MKDGTADRCDFEMVFGADLTGHREQCVRAAVAEEARVRRFARTVAWPDHELGRTDPAPTIFGALIIRWILVTPPDEELAPHLLPRLNELADTRPDPVLVADGAFDMHRTPWYTANVDLVVLGSDDGLELRRRVEPLLEAQVADDLAADLARDQRINEGTATTGDFERHFAAEAQRSHADLEQEAQARWAAREAGQQKQLTTIRECAAEVASYALDDDGGADYARRLQELCRLSRPHGQPGHDDWLEANLMWQILGPDLGEAIRSTIGSHADSGLLQPDCPADQWT